MSIFVNPSKTAVLVGCSRNNFSKMWKREKELPGTYTFFSETGKIDISDLSFIESYGDHVSEWEALHPVKLVPEKIKKEPVQKIQKKQEVKREVKPEPVKEVEKTPVAKTSSEKARLQGKKRTPKQEEQDLRKQEVFRERKNIDRDPELRELTEKASKAEKIKKINDAQISEINLKKARADLIEIETLGETCIGFLSALTQNIMEMPTGFIDEYDSAAKSGKTRTERIDILRAPICQAIKETKSSIISKLERAKRTARSYERKNNMRAPKL